MKTITIGLYDGNEIVGQIVSEEDGRMECVNENHLVFIVTITEDQNRP